MASLDRDSPNPSAPRPKMIDYAREQTARTRKLLDVAVELPPPDAFPGYTILREAHRGGQGIVYESIQQSTRQQVALKVIRDASLAGPKDKARFEREVEILAQLHHPHIVGIRDSGVSSGRYFFVMDFVAGDPIDVHLRRADLSVPDILRLFRRICEAIQAAHLRGVVHRDLKPSNVLVSADGSPHVLDFGAAALRGEGGIVSLHRRDVTHTGEFIGSFPWAAPEQVEGRSSDVDVRTDVYALGVLLFHALTERFPYPVSGPMQETLAHISHTEPNRPSRCREGLEIDVDWIVLKCLAKEPSRRYQSAGGLGADLGRYLDGQTVNAGPPSTFYTLKKLARRHRPLVVGGSIGLLALFAGTAIAAWTAGISSRQSEMALREAVRIRQGDYKLLGDDDRRAANTLNTLAMLLAKNVNYVEAEECARESLRTFMSRGLDEHELRQVTATLSDLGIVLADHMHAQEAAALLFREALAIRRGFLEGDSPEIAENLADLGEVLERQGNTIEAEPLLREALRIRRKLLGSDDLRVAKTLRTLATVLAKNVKYVEAEECASESLRIFKDRTSETDYRPMVMCDTIGLILFTDHRFAEAERWLLRAYEGLNNRKGYPLRIRRDMLTHLGELYEAWDAVEPGWGYAAKAAKYRAILAIQTNRASMTIGTSE